MLGAAYLPTDGYVDPSQLTFALAEGARRRGAEIVTGTRVTGIRVRRGRVEAVETDRGEIETEVVVNAGGMYARELGALAASTSRSCRWRTSTSSPARRAAARHADDARPLAARLLPPGVGGARDGRVRAALRAVVARRHPADFNSKLLEEDWPRFEELLENAIVRVPGLAEMEVVRLINGPEAFTPDGEFILGPVRGARLLGRGRLLRARARGRGRDGSAGRGVDRRGHAVARRLAHGLAPLRLRVPQRAYTLARTREVYETYYDVKYPGHERSAGRPLRVSPRTRACRRSAPCSARSPAGSGRTGSSRTPRAGTSRCGRAAGREALVAGDRRGAPRLPGGGGALRRDVVRQARRDGRGRGRLPRAAVRQPGRARGRPDHLHADAEPRGGIECDFTVSRLAEDRFRIVTGTAFGQHDLAWIAQHAPDDGSCRVEDVTSAYACYGLWGPRAREILQPLTSRPRQRGVPVHDRAGAIESAACRAWRSG